MANATRDRQDRWVLHVLHAFDVLSRDLDRLRDGELLYVLTELWRPAVAVCHCSCLASLLVLLNQLAHRIQRKPIFGCFPGRIIARWQVL